MTTETQVKQAKAKARRAKVGEVKSIAGEKSLTVAVEDLVKHPRYNKYVRQITKLGVHDEKGAAKVGDIVEIVPCRKLSKNKAHRLVRVVRSVG
ncbi:MAG: 30S ribosomal protein S17 [Phycisphaerae bacterium]|nr:30S ribosomal protein S17 [Phycisphaerae bacterium]